MSGIASSIGLITGIPIQDTIDQLISISAQPRDALVERTATLKNEQVAITELTALVIGVQLASDNLGKAEIYDAVSVNSSNTNLVTALSSGTPTKGEFSFRSIRQAQAHQALSGRLASDNSVLGAGQITFKTGGFLDDTMRLEDLNGGTGVERGQLRVTDRSGASSLIDLRDAATVKDVLDAINFETGINVTATTQGDSILLSDNTGQTSSNLIVQQVGTATTASDLGLSAVNAAANQATGSDIVSLSRNTLLSSLNDGNGVDFHASLAELQVTFRDNSTALQLNFANEKTLGELLDTINAADATRLTAQISSDGDRIELTDLTSDSGGTFAVSNLYSATTAADLGLDTTASGGTLSGRRVLGGLGTVLMSSLGGGDGLGSLGQLDLQDRSGSTATVNLTTAQTLDDVISLVNQSSVGIQARLNDTRNGIVLEDTSGGSGNLIISDNADGTQTATKLKLAVNSAVASSDSGSLDLQTVSTQTLLSDYNGGNGVAQSSFVITDSAGTAGAVNIASESLTTIGDVIDSINALSVGVTASFNATGDGIQLVDTAGGTGTLTVAESGTSTAASDLGIKGTASSVDLGSGPQQVIDGSQASVVTIDSDDKLDDLITKINSANIGISASKFNDGVGFRISLVSQKTGGDNRFQVSGLESLTQFSTVAEGQDALISLGDANSSLGVLASSSTNTFDQVINGVTFTTKGVSNDLLTISVEGSDTQVVSNAKLFADQFNKLHEKLKEYTSFQSNSSVNNPTVTTGLLFGTREALLVEQELGNLFTSRFFGAGTFQSLAEIGFDFKDDGSVSLDETKLKSQYASKPAEFEKFFTTATLGVSAKFKTTIDQLAGEGNSILLSRSTALQAKIDSNNERVTQLTSRLDAERLRLLKQFANLESTIQRLQANQTAVGNIQKIPPLGSTSDN